MYEAFTAVLLMAVSHIAISYSAAEVFKLDYPKYLAVTTGIGLVLGLILKVALVGWRERLLSVFLEEERQGELLVDVLLAVLTLLVGGAISMYIVWRRYGVAGWAGSLAANYIASWVV